MTTAEAATRLGVNQSRVRQFIKEGRLQSEKLGRDRIIHEDALAAFIEAQKERRPGPRARIVTRLPASPPPPEEPTNA